MTYINKFKKYCPMILFLFVVFSFSLNIQTANAQSKQKDTTIVSVNELTDLKGDEWAFKAVKELVEKYDVLEGKVADLDKRTGALETQVTEHKAILDEHEKRLAYAERRKGFILERLIKGVVVDIRDVTRGLLATILSPFDKKLS